jgi:hypothetical protein
MTKTIFFTVLLFSFSISVFAGNDSTKKRYTYLSLGTGYSQFRMIDRKVSPLLYRSGQSPNCLSFANITENSIFRTDLNFEYSFTSPDGYRERSILISSPNHNGVIRENMATFSRSSLIQDELNLEYLRRIYTNTTGKIDLFFGGQFKQYFSYSSTQAPVFVFSELSLNPSLLLRYRFSDTFESQSSLSIPLASLITQMPYSNDPTDGKHNYFISTFMMGSNVVTLNRFQRVNFQQSLQKRLNHRWAVALDYNFYWFHYRNVSDINAYDNAVTVKLMISLNSKK